MATKKVEEAVNPEVAAPEPEKTTEEIQQPEPPNEAEALKAQLKTLEESHKSLQRKYNQRFQEDQSGVRNEISGLASEISGVKDMIKILAAAQSQGIPTDEVEGMSTRQKTDLLKEYEVIERQQKLKREQEEYTRKATELWTRAQELFKENPDAEDQVYAYLKRGDIDLAERKIQRAEKQTVNNQPTEPKETEQELKKKLYDEVKKQVMKDLNLLDTETGLPSGAAKSFQDTEKGYNEGRITFEEYAKERAKRGM